MVICNEKKYCVPLSSPKDKHANMKNDLDFHRVIDSDGKLIGVLDFNCMIPVREDVIQEITMKVNRHDSVKEKHYKNLVIDQINFCQQNQDIIIAKAN